MSVAFTAVKYFVFAFNLFSLVLGICIICLSVIGVEFTTPDSEEHTYYIMGIILGSFICMTTLFGCYGAACESLGVNTIYAFFMLMLLIVQLLQMQVYQQRTFYNNTLERLERAWNMLETEPGQMLSIEFKYQCCGLYDSRDYSYKKLKIPVSCYQNRDPTKAENLYSVGCLDAIQAAYQSSMHRVSYFNWALLIAETVVFLYSSILSILLCRRYRQSHAQPVPGYLEQTPQNHDNYLYQNC